MRPADHDPLLVVGERTIERPLRVAVRWMRTAMAGVALSRLCRPTSTLGAIECVNIPTPGVEASGSVPNAFSPCVSFARSSMGERASRLEGSPSVLPEGVRHWSLTTLREKLIKIGGKVVCHARYVTFQMADVAIPHKLFREILRRFARLKMKRPLPAPG